MTVLLEARRVSKVFGSGMFHKRRTAALEGFSLAIASDPPSITAIVGESGSGKTTLLHLIAGILPADGGTIAIAGESMTGRSEPERDRLRARRVGIVFQTFNLLPSMTALENVELGMSFRPGVRAAREAARSALARVGLAKRMGHRPEQLSVGQQQRVAIARALAGEPTLVLADEPTANLDKKNAAACLDLLVAFCQERSATLLVVSHDPDTVARFSRVIPLEAPVEGAAAS
jgi:putative ABC transport system ATP-binding protein